VQLIDVMLTLDDPIWRSAEGGYRMTYDASVALRRLESTRDADEEDELLDELWDNLHHQGDVGLASYMALPQLGRLAKVTKLFYWKLIGLCAVIEAQRHKGSNPELPVGLKGYYMEGLTSLRDLVLRNLRQDLDADSLRMSFAMLALCDGKVKLGRTLLACDDDVADEVLESYG